MTDIPDIPIGEVGSEIVEGAATSPEIIESGESGIENLVEGTEEIIDGDLEEAIKAGDDYQEELIGEAEDLGVSQEAIEGTNAEIEGLNGDIENEAKKTKKEIEGDEKPEGIEKEETENMDWVEEPLDKETEKFLNENGYENLTENFTPEELIKLRQLESEILDKVKNINAGGSLNSLLEQIPEGEERDRTKEFIKIMLRIAIKVAAKTTAAIAKNIAKNSDDKTSKVIFGTIADLTESGGKFLDSVISDEKLSKEIQNYFTRRSLEEE